MSKARFDDRYLAAICFAFFKILLQLPLQASSCLGLLQVIHLEKSRGRMERNEECNLGKVKYREEDLFFSKQARFRFGFLYR